MAFRIGIVGAGLMGSRIGARIAGGDIPAFEIAGIHDLDEARSRSLAADFSVSHYDSMAALAADADALYIATPDGAHLQPCLAAAEAKTPFLVEKPLATTVEDAEAICNAVAAAGIAAEVNFSNRWNPPFVAAKQEMANVGRHITLFSRLNNTILSPTQNLNWAGATTSAWFLLSHCIDLAFWLHGKTAISVYASGVRGLLDSKSVSTWDSIHAIIRYDDGSDATFESVWALPEGNPSPVEFTFRLVGDQGAFTVDTTEQMISVTTGIRSDNPIVLNWTPERFRSFAATLDGAEPSVPVTDGLENTRVLVALHRSLESRQVEPVA